MPSHSLPVWEYVAQTPGNKRKSGTIKAETAEDAIAKLRLRNLFVTEIKLKSDPKQAKNMASTKSLVRNLKKEGLEEGLIKSGKLIPIEKTKKE